MYHLRFTPYDISGYTFDFVKCYDRYIVARELKDDEGNDLLHYHILIDTDYGQKSIRDAVKQHLRIPKADGKGRNNKYYALMSDWKDMDYITKYYDIIVSKGWTQPELLNSAVSGKKKYLDTMEKVKDDIPATVSEKKPPKLPFQQAVIASAAADWYKYKRQCRDNDDTVEKDELKKFVCDAMREHGRGVNTYLVRELCYAVLYDDLDYKDYVLSKISL